MNSTFLEKGERKIQRNLIFLAESLHALSLIPFDNDKLSANGGLIEYIERNKDFFFNFIISFLFYFTIYHHTLVDSCMTITTAPKGSNKPLIFHDHNQVTDNHLAINTSTNRNDDAVLASYPTLKQP